MRMIRYQILLNMLLMRVQRKQREAYYVTIERLRFGALNKNSFESAYSFWTITFPVCKTPLLLLMV